MTTPAPADTRPRVYVTRPPSAPRTPWYRATRSQLRGLLPHAVFITWSDISRDGGTYDELWPPTLTSLSGLAVAIPLDSRIVGPRAAAEIRDMLAAGLPVLVCRRQQVALYGDCQVSEVEGGGGKLRVVVPDGVGLPGFAAAVALMGGQSGGVPAGSEG